MKYFSLENAMSTYKLSSKSDFDHFIRDKEFLEVNGQQYDVDEIERSLTYGSIPVERRLEYDRLIDQNPPLKDLLIKYTVDLTNSRWYRVDYNMDFYHFISPYYAYAFNRVMQQFLEADALQDAGKWINYSKFYERSDEGQAFLYTGEYLERLKEDLSQRQQDKGYAVTINPVWGAITWSNFLNGLPMSFKDVRLEIISLLTRFVLIFQSKPHQESLHVSQNLTELKDIPAETYDIIHATHRKIHRLDEYDAADEESSFFGKGTWWSIIVFVILLVKFLIRCDRMG